MNNFNVPAFPVRNEDLDQRNGSITPNCGLTKREYFAVMICQGISSLSFPADHLLSGYDDKTFNEIIARDSVKRADALLAELDKRKL